jgi:hypothetical protein
MRSQMSERRQFFTITRLGLTLWATTMVLFAAIPQRYWQYPGDLWLRVMVIAPAMAAMGLFLFDRWPSSPDNKSASTRGALWQDLEVIMVTFVGAGIVYWKFMY